MKIKPGIKTTEFWLTLGAVTVQALMTYLQMMDGTWATIGITALTALYNVLRRGEKSDAAQVAAIQAGGSLRH